VRGRGIPFVELSNLFVILWEELRPSWSSGVWRGGREREWDKKPKNQKKKKKKQQQQPGGGVPG
jgi:hypothetical protein